MIKNLKRDIQAIAANPNFNEDDNLRTEEAYLEKKLAHLLKVVARNEKADMKANLATHGEKLGGIWSALNKEKKPRDLITRLKVPASNPTWYEHTSARMAELAKNYHDDLQNQNIEPQENDERTTDIELTLRTIPAQQTLEAPESLLMNSLASEAHVQMALKHTKNNTASGKREKCLDRLYMA